MSLEENDKLDKVLAQLEKMNRGLYGDPDNKVVGLMQDHFELKADVLKLKEKDKYKTWTIAAFTSGASFGLPFLWDWFKQHFK